MRNNSNNYHFGRHVFDYFPWNKYNNENIYSDPVVNMEIHRDFKFAFSDEFSPASFFWYDNSVTISKLSNIFNDDSRIYRGPNNIITYRGISETAYTWEDIEKIRLRCIFGVEDVANRYMKIIDLYTKNRYLILDALYLDSGEEEIETPLISLSDIVNREQEELCMEFISESDVYESINKRNYKRNKFTDSISEFFRTRGYLTEKQVSAFAKTSYKEILSNKDMVFFSIKTNKLRNIDRMIKYFESIELTCKKTNNLLLIY
jgi:hypothetical protein